ncbi:MAG: aminotransferase class V-fold PLP-dependent enzyme, partial [Humibacter sp.]
MFLIVEPFDVAAGHSSGRKGHPMILEQLYTESLSQATYLIGDESSGEAVIVDPLRDVHQYLDAAKARELRIVGAFVTHFHADFLAGHLELAAATGAWIGMGSRATPGFAATLFDDGDRVSLGQVELEIMSSPGHTPESISILVFRHPDDAVAEAVLTGDSLFVGDVGRVDLQASFGADPVALAHEQFDTIQHRFMSLDDAIRVLPAHGAGSACGKNLSLDRESTIGRERRSNASCSPMSETEFVRLITTGQLPVPDYFTEDARLNRERHALYDPSGPLPLVDELTPERLAGVILLDTRDVEDFAAGHLQSALNVPLDGRFAETAGMFLDYSTDVVLVASPGLEAEGRRQLARIGFDRVTGYVPSDQLAGHGVPIVTGARVEPIALESLRERESTVLLDVRSPGEFESGAIPGALNIPLAQLRRRRGEIPAAGHVVVNCESGWRSGVAASYLSSQGFAAEDLRGGFEAWTAKDDTPFLDVVGDDLQAPLLRGGTIRYANLDYAASAPALKRVADRVTEVLPYYASVHRGAGYASQVSTAAYEGARATVAELMGCRTDDSVIFTRNTTDSLNLMASVVPGETVVLDLEHHANLLPWLDAGARVVPVARTIAETLARLDAELAAHPAAALAITAASNVSGEVLPIERFAEVAHRHDARIVVDGAQLVPHRRVDVAASGIDYLAFSGHKVYAPFGSGVLLGRGDWLDAADPYLRGGGAVERVTLDSTTWRTGSDRHEAGSPNVLGAVALA